MTGQTALPPRLIVPTPAAPVEILAVTRRPATGRARSVVLKEHSFEPLAMSPAYRAFLASEGPLGLLPGGRGDEVHILQLSRDIDGGDSWNLPVLIAHLVDRDHDGLRRALTEAPQALVIATGSLAFDPRRRLEEQTFRAERYALAGKVAACRPLIEAAGEAPVIVLLPAAAEAADLAAAEAELLALSARVPNLRYHRCRDVGAALAVLRGTDLVRVPPPTDAPRRVKRVAAGAAALLVASAAAAVLLLPGRTPDPATGQASVAEAQSSSASGTAAEAPAVAPAAPAEIAAAPPAAEPAPAAAADGPVPASPRPEPEAPASPGAAAADDAPREPAPASPPPDPVVLAADPPPAAEPPATPSAEAGPPPPEAAAPEDPDPEPAATALPPVTVDALLAPPGRVCFDLVLGTAAPVVVPAPVVARGEKLSAALPAGACGIAVGSGAGRIVLARDLAGAFAAGEAISGRAFSAYARPKASLSGRRLAITEGPGGLVIGWE